jgi:hypothetical protein
VQYCTETIRATSTARGRVQARYRCELCLLDNRSAFPNIVTENTGESQPKFCEATLTADCVATPASRAVRKTATASCRSMGMQRAPNEGAEFSLERLVSHSYTATVLRFANSLCQSRTAAGLDHDAAHDGCDMSDWRELGLHCQRLGRQRSMPPCNLEAKTDTQCSMHRALAAAQVRRQDYLLRIATAPTAADSCVRLAQSIGGLIADIRVTPHKFEQHPTSLLMRTEARASTRRSGAAQAPELS